jgi:hypothetical protein
VAPSGFHALPEWARLVLPVVLAVGALREAPGRRFAWLVSGFMIAFILNRERFGYSFWLHPIVWACSAYLIFVGATGRAPAHFETRRFVLSAIAVVVGFMAALAVGLVWLH